jgi:hypothetical protein
MIYTIIKSSVGRLPTELHRIVAVLAVGMRLRPIPGLKTLGGVCSLDFVNDVHVDCDGELPRIDRDRRASHIGSFEASIYGRLVPT